MTDWVGPIDHCLYLPRCIRTQTISLLEYLSFKHRSRSISMFKRILVPLDGSGRAERALPIAARMARACGGSILLVRVVSTEPAALPSVPTKPNLIQTVGEADRMLAESYLAGWASSDLLPGLSVQIQVPVGLIPPSIIAVATENHADIIVMCSHGYTGGKHWWMLGSVAAKMARFAQIPVATLREGRPGTAERHPCDGPQPRL